MRAPDPIATTTTEAYLAYKAGFLRQDELKPKLYEPYLHLDAWLAYWCGLTASYPLNEQGSPECLTDEEAIIAYLSEVTDTFPRTAKDPSDSRMAAYLRHLADSSFDTPEEVLTNSEFYLYNIGSGTPSTVSGDTPITLESAAKYPIDEAKLYGMTYQGVPDGYTRVEYLEGNNSGYVPTDIKLSGTDTLRMKIATVSATNSTCLIGCYSGTSASTNFSIYTQFSVNSICRYGSESHSVWKLSANTEYTLEMSSTGLTVNGSVLSSWSAETFTSPKNMFIGWINDSASRKFIGKLYEVEVVGRFNGVPCKRNSDNALGYYDTVTNTFFPAEGTLTAGPEVSPAPTTPVPIYCNNGELKVNQQGQVYADGPQETISLTHNSTTIDTATAENLLAIDTYKDVQDLISGSVTRNVGIKVLDGTETYVEFSTGVFYCRDALPNAKYATNVSILCNLFVGRESGGGSSSTANYQCWLQATRAYLRLYIRHDTMNDATSFKNWVTQQYVNGTPVIVVYPLEESTTSSVTAQGLECQEGTNIVSSNKGAREMEITYHRLQCDII